MVCHVETAKRQACKACAIWIQPTANLYNDAHMRALTNIKCQEVSEETLAY